MGLIGVFHCGKGHLSDMQSVIFLSTIRVGGLLGQCLPPEAENYTVKKYVYINNI